jgi:hypothetical protein
MEEPARHAVAPETTPNSAEAAPTRKSKAKAKPEKAERKLSCLDAAAKVPSESNEPMNAKEMIEAMETKGYWTSPGGKTPSATLYSAILRELGKGKDSRFKKTDRGKFALNG